MRGRQRRRGILYVVNSVNMGGVMTHIIELSKYISHYYDVYLAGSEGTWSDFVSSIGTFKKVYHVFPSIEELKRKEIGLVHFHDIRSLLKVTIRNGGKPFGGNIPIISTVHGLPIRRMFHMGGIFNYIAYLKRSYERFLLNKTNHIICVSHEDKQFLMKYYHIEKCKMSVIYYGIDFNSMENIISSRKDQVAKELGVEKLYDKYTIIIVPMRFDYQKAPEIIAQAIIKANRIINKNVQFVLIGGGKQYIQVTNLLKNEKNVIFTGPLTPNDVYKWMYIADALILGSRWEGLPITLIEAGFFALPVIATNVPGTREIIYHDYTGFLVDKDNADEIAIAIQKFLMDRQEFEEYGRNLRRLVLRRHNLREMGKQIINLYDRFMLLRQ